MTPRLDCPKRDNLFYVSDKEGGLNPAIPRPSGSKLIFQNCVFYALGRFAELWGIWLRSTNAENFISVAKEMGLQVSNTPVAGAIIVWAKGKVGNSKDGAGHVACVEIVNKNDIVTSESGWSANKPFWTQTRKKGGNWGQSSAYRFLGFILPPKEAATPTDDTTTAPKEEKPVSIKKGDSGAAVKSLQSALKAAGTIYDPGTIDGSFGDKTERALVYYQFRNGLTIDGICGPATKAKLKLK